MLAVFCSLWTSFCLSLVTGFKSAQIIWQSLERLWLVFSHWYGAEGKCRAHCSISSHLKDILGSVFAGRFLYKSQWGAMGSRTEAGQAALCCWLSSRSCLDGPSVPLLIPTQGIMALRFLRGTAGCNPLLRESLAVGWCWDAKQCFHSEDAALLQLARYVGSSGRSVMVCACYSACQWEFGFCVELLVKPQFSVIF